MSTIVYMRVPMYEYIHYLCIRNASNVIIWVAGNGYTYNNINLHTHTYTCATLYYLKIVSIRNSVKLTRREPL